MDGAAPGLYGGTQKIAGCEVEQQVKVLRAAPDKNRAFASVQDIEPSAVPDYLRGLTPVTLRMDTRVTNHGYRDGEPAQRLSGCAPGGDAPVLADDRGVPRVRCACGNPLLPPDDPGTEPAPEDPPGSPDSQSAPQPPAPDTGAPQEPGAGTPPPGAPAFG
ncbi:DUF6777 domain-containing protein [Streptomyces pakalii]|uniref:DUF6777 domain-containing protein n=1 Tax=Streptomyces pakalii TaxID=3036494 RepID=UPI0037DA77CD